MSDAMQMFQTATTGIQFTGFELNNLPVEGTRYNGDSVLIDRRFLTRFADEFLTESFNIEFISRACSERATRAAVMDALGNDTMGKVFKDLYKTPFVEVDRPLFVKGDIFTAVRNVMSAPDAEKAAAVITEIMLSVLKPLGVVDGTDKGYVILDQHFSFFPSYDDFLIDIWAREIEKVLHESRRIDVGSGRSKLGTSVVAARLAAVAADLELCFHNVGDYAVYANDTLTLVRAALLPKEARLPSAPFYPAELVSHPVIKALASNFSIARMALKHAKPGGELRTGIFLRDRLPQVSAFFFESKRYIKVSFADFIQHFKKSSFKTLVDQRFIGSLLAYNLEGAPAAQAVTSSRSLMLDGVRSIREREATTKVLQAHYGSLMKSVCSDEVHSIASSVLDAVYTGQHVERQEAYLATMFPSTLIDQRDVIVETLAVAVTALGENGSQVFICEAGGEEDHFIEPLEGDRAFALGFHIPVNGYHLPISGVVSHELWALHDPYEVVALTKDWSGSYYLADKLQVIPQQALRKYLVGDTDLGLAPVRGYGEMTLDINGVTLRGGFQFLGGMINSSERDSMVVKPLLNAQVVHLAVDVMNDLLNILDAVVVDVPHRIQYKRYVYSFWNNAATRGVGESVINVYRQAVKESCASNAKRKAMEMGPLNDDAVLASIRRVQSALDESFAERCINLFVLDQIMQLLSLVESSASAAGRPAPLFSRMKEDTDFSLIMGGM